MPCNIICEGACPDGGCGLNILDDCGDCVDPPDRGDGGDKFVAEGGAAEALSPKDALLNFLLRDERTVEIRKQLAEAVAEARSQG